MPRNKTQKPQRKFVYQLLVCLLHPVAVALIWMRLPFRKDLSFNAKIGWGALSRIPLVPFVYVLTGNELR